MRVRKTVLASITGRVIGALIHLMLASGLFSKWSSLVGGSGESGFPEHEAVFPADGKPVEACKRCRTSIIENHEAILNDEEREEFERLRYARIIQFIFLVCVLTSVFMSMFSE